MQKKYLFLFGLAVLLFSGCCEDSYWYLPDTFRDVTVFGSESRWVYRSSLTEQTDTLDMRSSTLRWVDSPGMGGCEGHNFTEQLEQRVHSSYREGEYKFISREGNFRYFSIEAQFLADSFATGGVIAFSNRLEFGEGSEGFYGNVEEIGTLEVDGIEYSGVFSEKTAEDPLWFGRDVIRYYAPETGMIRMKDLETEEVWDLIFVDVSPLNLAHP